jgi:hypothetical protein
MRGRSRFSVHRYRRERLVALERRCEFLEAERARLERLLGVALRVATGDTCVTESALLGVICELVGTDPARAAFVEERNAA